MVHDNLGKKSHMQGVKDMITAEGRTTRSSTHPKRPRDSEDARGAGRQQALASGHGVTQDEFVAAGNDTLNAPEVKELVSLLSDSIYVYGKFTTNSLYSLSIVLGPINRINQITS